MNNRHPLPFLFAACCLLFTEGGIFAQTPVEILGNSLKVKRFEYIGADTAAALEQTRDTFTVRLILENTDSHQTQFEMHVGHIEHVLVFQNGQIIGRVGFLESFFSPPKTPLSIPPLSSQTIDIQCFNKIFPQKYLQLTIGTPADIFLKETSWREQKTWWRIFQIGFFAVLLFQLFYHAVHFWMQKEKEYLYYGIYIFAWIAFFLPFIFEIYQLTFSYRFGQLYFFYFFKIFIILYSWSYFKFYKHCFNFNTDVPKVKQIFDTMVRFQIGMVAVEILLFLLPMEGLMRIKIFTVAGAFSLLAVAIYSNFALKNHRQYDNNWMDKVALGANLGLVLTVYELFRGAPILSATNGFFFLQVAILVETFGTTIALKQKSLFTERRLQQEKDEQILIAEQLKRQVAEVEVSALRTQLNPHFLFNCLTSINLHVAKGETEQAGKRLTQFSTLMRNVLKNAQRDKIPLEEELATLKLYIELEQMRHEGKFKYKMDIATDVSLIGCQLPPMILQPLVENAIWFGILRKNAVDTEGGNLLIKVVRNQKQHDIYIEDNGVNYSNMATSNSEVQARTNERLALLQDVFKERIQFKMETLTNEKAEIIGNRMVLSVL